MTAGSVRAVPRPRTIAVVAAVVALLASAVVWRVTTGGEVVNRDSGVPFPRTLAAIGDSITRAANVEPGKIGDDPRRSWATGEGDDDVDSLVERIRNASDVDTRGVNVAFSGARMVDAPAQAAKAVDAGADVVTIELGANDVCAPDVAAMTQPADYERHLRAAMDTLMTGLPEAHVLVLSIPDVASLRGVLGDDARARLVWRTFRICGSVLTEGAGQAELDAVRARTVELNEVLASVCDEHDRCRHDAGAAFRHRFDADDVSSLDYFHPSIAGQQAFAEVAWRASWWGPPG